MRRLSETPTRVGLGLLVLLAVVVMANGYGTFHTDIKPEVYLAPQEMLPAYLSAWTDRPYLGSPNFNVGLAPVVAVIALLRWLGMSPELAFKVFHLALWSAAALGAARLTRDLAPRASRWAPVVAATLYLVNPYAVTAGSTLAIALPMALLPWQMCAIVRAMRNPGSWWWPAAFGLCFFLMSGMNLAVVPLLQLLAVPSLVWALRQHGEPGKRTVAWVLAKCGFFVLLLSAYWLVPGAFASRTGSQVVGASEVPADVGAVSNAVEVLRGLGLWPLYGRAGNSQWVPEHAVYVTNPVVVLLTLALPALGLLAMGRGAAANRSLRRFAVPAVLVAAVVMIGLFPGKSPASPLGRLMAISFEKVPLTAAFRTTNKAGAVLVLGLALIAGVGLARWFPRLLRRPLVAPIVVNLTVLVVVVSVIPALTNRLYTSPMVVPAYWKQAAAALTQGDQTSRVLQLPAQDRANYRWTPERVDDVTNSLFPGRDAVVLDKTPNASPATSNFVAAFADASTWSTRQPGLVSTFARYLGANQVLARRDMQWERTGGLSPGNLDVLANSDGGLAQSQRFGGPGENVFSVDAPPTSDAEAVLSPLQLYAVDTPRATVRTESLAGSIYVVGDAWSLPQMLSAGLLKGTPTFRYAAGAGAPALPTVLGEDRRIVLTDTNARRRTIANRASNTQGDLMAADEQPWLPRYISEDTDDQTVLVRSGAKVTASTRGGTFFDVPFGAPDNLVDGDPRTAWYFGDFGSAVGATARVELGREQPIGVVELAQIDAGPSKVDRVTLSAGGRDVSVTVPDSGRVRADLSGVKASSIEVRVDSQRGNGYNMVALSELEIPGVRVTRTARLPLTLQKQYAALPAADRARFAATPLDVLLARVTNTGAATDDAETQLSRDFALPDRRTFAISGTLRGQGSGETVLDALDGYPGTVRATSSGFFFDNPDLRASRAADGSPSTAWVPADQASTRDLPGAWWQLESTRRAIPAVTVTQAPGVYGASQQTRYATRATVSIDGKPVASGALGRGSHRIPLPAGTQGRVVRVTLDEFSAGKQPPRVTSVDTGVQMAATTDIANRCIEVGTLDGKPLRMRPAPGSATDKVAGGQAGNAQALAGGSWMGCGPSTTLAAGEHSLRPVPGIAVDSLRLRDVTGERPVVPVRQRPLRVTEDSASRVTATIPASPSERVVVLGQGYNENWGATLGGRDLGKPVLVDGYSTGWVLPPGSQGRLVMDYRPAGLSSSMLALSGLGLLACLALAIDHLLRRRRDEVRLAAERERAGIGTEELDPQDDETGPRARGSRTVQMVGAALGLGFALGLPGLVVGPLVVWLLHRGIAPRHITATAAWSLLGAGLLAVILLPGKGSQLFIATSMSRSMLPHWLAAAALAAACVAGFWHASDAQAVHEAAAGGEDRPGGGDVDHHRETDTKDTEGEQ